MVKILQISWMLLLKTKNKSQHVNRYSKPSLLKHKIYPRIPLLACTPACRSILTISLTLIINLSFFLVGKIYLQVMLPLKWSNQRSPFYPDFGLTVY